MAIDSEFLSSSQEIINIQIVIDTDAITNDYPNPSQDPNNPTGLPHTYMYMVATRGNTIGGSGGADLNVKADVGDVIRWYAVSEYGNFDSSVVIYKLAWYAQDVVFDGETFNVYNRTGILPAKGTAIPVGYSVQNFWFNQATVVAKGTEQYNVQFALYVRQRGVDQPVLFGYYYWDPTITVQS
ncbi:inclusion body protein [Mucilaginibacter oryzae]|uniref:Inclusion body protein n=1 Tax=Mucilaginibacter oryzae TaxID=468058 RepID=A0A316HCU0_9SPHI|nr:inclusion body family protein [Mucilaginibacter oryzae]PWK78338.1 inclusion body protein [Mucilaginibacter oryzae]